MFSKFYLGGNHQKYKWELKALIIEGGLQLVFITMINNKHIPWTFQKLYFSVIPFRNILKNNIKKNINNFNIININI